MKTVNVAVPFSEKLSRTEKALHLLFQHWTMLLGLRWWEEVKIQTYATRNDMPEEQRVSGAAAFASVSWEYKQAACGFCLELLAGYSPIELERVVVHELGHLLVNAMRDYDKLGIKIEELVVTNLTQALIWTAAEWRGVGGGGRRYRQGDVGRGIGNAEYGKELRSLVGKRLKK